MAQVMSPHLLHPDTPRPRNLGEQRPPENGKRERRGERPGAGASPCARVGGVSPSPHPAPGRYPRIILVFPKIILIFSRNILNFPLSPEGLSGLKKGGSSYPSTLRVLPRIITELPQCYPKFFPGLSQLSPGFPKFPQ